MMDESKILIRELTFGGINYGDVVSYKEYETLKQRITELENALNDAADDVEKQKVVGEGRRLHYSHKYRAIAKGEDNE